jgi:hypothetical protein
MMIIERYYVVLARGRGPLEYHNSKEIHRMIIKRYYTVLEGEDL